MRRIQFICMLLVVLMLTACASPQPAASGLSEEDSAETVEPAGSEAVQTAVETGGASPGQSAAAAADVSDGFVYIEGGMFEMGSPDSEAWRSADETQHEVTVSSFWLDPLETTQEQYEALMGANPSQFSGSNLPVENVSWLDAVR